MITIACVYKSGKKFNISYVEKLYNMVSRNMTLPFEFVCLTDVQADVPFRLIKLKYELPGWWSKFELFRHGIYNTDYVLYFDLDTLILRNIDEITEVVRQHEFLMLRGFNLEARKLGDTPASGIMGFKVGSEIINYIYSEFFKDPALNIRKTEAKGGPGGQGGDQGFTGDLLGWDNIKKFQDYLPEGYIAGKQVVKNYKMVMPDYNIVAWSGYPTLEELYNKQVSYQWVNKIWK
jgi:hypothetical protein